MNEEKEVFVEDETKIVDEKEGDFYKNDYKKNKYVYAFSYLLFFLPLIVNKDSKLGRFYANQGLLFLLTSLGIVFVNILLAFVPFLGIVISNFLSLGIFLVLVYAIYSVFNKKIWKLPLIGEKVIIKK